MLTLALGGCVFGPPVEGVVFWVDDAPYTQEMRDSRPDAAVARDALGLAAGAELPEAETRDLEALMLNEALALRKARLLGWRPGELPWPPADAVARLAEGWGPADLVSDPEARADFLERHGLTEDDVRAHVETLLVESSLLEVFFEVHEGDVTRCLEDNEADLQAQWEREAAGLAEENRPATYSEEWARHACTVAIEQRRRGSEDFMREVRTAIAEGARVRFP